MTGRTHQDLLPGTDLLLDDTVKLHVLSDIGDGLLHIVRKDGGTTFLVEDRETGSMGMPDIGWYEDMVEQERIKPVGRPGSPRPPGLPALPSIDRDEILRRDPKAALKLHVVTELVARGARCSDPDISRHLRDIGTKEVVERLGEMPPPSTARRWLRRFGGFDVRLVDVASRTGLAPRESRLDPWMRERVDRDADWYYDERGYRLADVEARVEAARVAENLRRAAEGEIEPEIPAVSRETVRRAINGIRCRENLERKYGKEWVRRRHDVSGEPLVTQRFLQIGMMDDKEIDCVFCFDAETRLPVGKPWLTVLIDFHTRCILGWHISWESPSMLSAAETIRRGMLPKTVRPDRLERWPVLRTVYGHCSEIIVDNASNYTSPAIVDALLDVGVTLRWAKVYTPTHKSVVERVFASFKSMLTQKLPGATLDIKAMREAGYDPAKHALLTITEFEDAFREWLHLYHIKSHSGIGMQPARAWSLQQALHVQLTHDDPSSLRMLASHTEWRVLTRNGFTLLSLRYNGSMVEGLLEDMIGLQKVGDRIDGTASARVKIRYSASDLGSIDVWNQRRRRYVTVPAVNQRYASGLSLYQHRQLRAWAKRENHAFSTESEQLVARAELNEMIRQLVPDVDARERRAMTRLLGTSTPATEPPPPVAEAEPRFDGMGAVVAVTPFADEREDGDQLTTRPDRKQPKPTSPSPLVEDDFAPRGPDDDWDDEETDTEDHA